MADELPPEVVTVQELDSATSVSDTDVLPIGQGPSGLKKASIAQLRARLLGGAANAATATAAAYAAAADAATSAAAANDAAGQLSAALSQVESATTTAGNAATRASGAAALAEAQAEAAEDAAAAATTAAASTDGAIATANTAAANADEKASLANAAATNANEKAALVGDAVTSANTAADRADSQAEAAEDAAAAANSAVEALGTVKEDAIGAASNANAKATLAGNAASVATAAAEAAQAVVDDNETALAAKQDKLTAPTDVPGLADALAGKVAHVSALAALKALPTAQAAHYDGAAFAFDGSKDYSADWDDKNFIKSDHEATGAWVRQGADKIRASVGTGAGTVEDALNRFGSPTIAVMKATDFKAGSIVDTRGAVSEGDGGNARYAIVTDEAFAGTPDGYTDHALDNGNVAKMLPAKDMRGEAFGITGGTAGSNTCPNMQSAVNAISNAGGGTLRISSCYWSGSFEQRSNVRIVVEGDVLHENGTIYFGQWFRTDAPRCKGAFETAYDGGTLTANTSQLPFGGRWNDTAGDFSNEATTTPQAGDLLAVFVGDMVDAEANRPVYAGQYLRRVEAYDADNSIIQLDRTIPQGGDCFYVFMSRGLGYDRASIGGYGRMNAIENASIELEGGTYTNHLGHITWCAALRCRMVGSGYVQDALIGGNAARECTFDVKGIFHRHGVELALGHEAPYFKRVHGKWQSYPGTPDLAVSMFQLGERGERAMIGDVDLEGVNWGLPGPTAPQAASLAGNGIKIVEGGELRVKCAAQVGLSIGGTNYPADDFLNKGLIRIELTPYTDPDTEAVTQPTTLLTTANGLSNVDLGSIKLDGPATTNAVSLGTGTGRYDSLKVTGTSAAVRVGSFTGGMIDATGSVARDSGTFGLLPGGFRGNNIKDTLTGASAGGDYAPDASASRDHLIRVTMTADVALADPTNMDVGDALTLIFVQPSSGTTWALAPKSGQHIRGLPTIAAGAVGSYFTMTLRAILLGATTAYVVESSSGAFA